MKHFFLLIFITLSTFNCLSQSSPDIISSGPMLGYNEMMEVMIWVQLNEEAEVHIKYWDIDTPSIIGKTQSINTSSNDAFIAHLTCKPLEPGTKYIYEVWVNNKKKSFPYSLNFKTQDLWQWRTDAPDFSIAIGSCAFISEEKYDRPGKPYGGEYHIFESIADKNPELMLWLGDNVYLREVDWNTKTGIYHRYTHTRAIPEMQRLLASAHHYAIWDDHDFGPNDANSSFVHKDLTLQAFNSFWANTPCSISGVKGNTFQFQYNDVDFFMLDNRFYRTDHNLKGGKSTMLGKKQIDWLIQALKDSHAHFKMVALGSPFLNTVDKWENYERYKKEKSDILQRIQDNGITGVVFLTGDKHSSELNSELLKNGETIYDFTVSPLTSKTYDNCNEENKNRIEGSCYPNRNFATIDVTGDRENRVLTLNLFDNNGTAIWTYRIDYNYKLSKVQ